MEGDGVSGEEPGPGHLARDRVLGEHREPVVDGVVHEHSQVGYAHLGVVLDAVTPQCVDSSDALEIGGR